MALTWGRPRLPDRLDGLADVLASERLRETGPALAPPVQSPAEYLTRPASMQPENGPSQVPTTGPMVTNGETRGWQPARDMGPAFNPAGLAVHPMQAASASGPLDAGSLGSGLLSVMTDPMRAALAAKARPKFFDKEGGWRDVVGIAADAISTAGGGQATYLPLKMHREEVQRQDRKDSLLAMREQAELLEKARLARRPKLMTVPGVGVVGIDEDTLDQRTVVADRSDSQTYADSLGYQPGTPAYVNALKDYTLRGNGPTAMEGRTALQDDRQSAAVDALLRRLDQGRQIAELRDGTTRRGQDLGSSDRRYSTTTASADRQRGQDVSSRDRNRAVDVGSRDRRESASFRGGPAGGRGRAGGTSAARIINPKTGRAAVLKAGKWVDEATGTPLS